MPPQQQELMDPSILKSASSGDYSVGSFGPVELADRNPSEDASNSREESYRAAEEWLSRTNVASNRSPLRDAMNRYDKDSPLQATSGEPIRTSLRERLHARMKESARSSEPLHAEATLKLLTKGLSSQIVNPPPPPAPHTSPTSQTGARKSNHELDWFLASEKNSTVSTEAPPPPRLAQRSRSPRVITPPDPSLKKQKTSTSDAVARIIETLKENHEHDAASAAAAQASLLKLSRQVKYGKKVNRNVVKENSIKLHIYDLLTTETYMQIGPWGCEFPIGQCFNAMNDGLHALGTGAYHCGIEINGIEYAYGANNMEGTTGVFSCIPKQSPGFEYRTTLDFGSRPLTKRSWVRVAQKDTNTCVYREVVTYIDGREVMKEMAKEYLGPDYDLLRRNCCTFARDASLRLGIREDEIPSWFMNLADAGAATHDVAVMTLKPITSMLSGIEDDDDSIIDTGRKEEKDEGETFGFEVVANAKEGRTLYEMELNVIEALDTEGRVGVEPSCGGRGERGPIEVRRTCSWA